MARPTPAQLATAGFSQMAGTAAKYVKSNTTAVAVVDLATGGASSGVASVGQAAAGTPITAADWNAHVASLGQLGLTVSPFQEHGPGVTYVGQSV